MREGMRERKEEGEGAGQKLRWTAGASKGERTLGVKISDGQRGTWERVEKGDETHRCSSRGTALPGNAQ